MVDLARLRVDQVGSLVRPEGLRRTYALHAEGLATEDALRTAQDDAVREVIRRQERLGFPVVGDGELRREQFADSFADVRGACLPAGSLRLVRNRPLEEFQFAQDATDRPVKVTVLSIDHTLALRTSRGPAQMLMDERLVGDAIEVQREIVRGLVAAGCRSVQMDGPGYARYTDPGSIAQLRGLSVDPLELLRRAAAADAAVLDGFSDVTFAMHLCHRERRAERRGELVYDGAAEVLFNCLPHQRLLIECDAPEHVSFEALRFVPRGKVVVLGLVSTRRTELEDEELLLRRIDDACRFISVDQLAVSTQCGFAPHADQVQCDEAIQWEKLELVLRIAERVWGRVRHVG